MPTIRLTLNGKETDASYEPGMTLLDVLREECDVLSPKSGCAPEGACGCCLVNIDGKRTLDYHAGRASGGAPHDHRGVVRTRRGRPVRFLHPGHRDARLAPHRSGED